MINFFYLKKKIWGKNQYLIVIFIHWSIYIFYYQYLVFPRPVELTWILPLSEWGCSGPVPKEPGLPEHTSSCSECELPCWCCFLPPLTKSYLFLLPVNAYINCIKKVYENNYLKVEYNWNESTREKWESEKEGVCVSPLHLGQLLNFHKEIHVHIHKLSDCRLHLLW